MTRQTCVDDQYHFDRRDEDRASGECVGAHVVAGERLSCRWRSTGGDQVRVAEGKLHLH